MSTKQLYDNIMWQKTGLRYTYDQIGEALGYKKGVFQNKMERLKAGSETAISVSDIAKMLTLFKCSINVLCKGITDE